jgi:BirA family biotin operon repressor/biotin-[acetyl-CoA-carboxylase] ligase
MDTSQTYPYHGRNGWLGHRVLFRSRTPSTNDWALELAESGAAEGLVLVADEQTAGRGRLDRTWSAPPGACLLLSIIFHPHLPFHHNAARISMACGLALLDAVRTMTGVPVILKWPNDLIVLRQKGWGKLSGMLSEMGLMDGQPKILVVGIGLNVNVPAASLPSLAPDAASLLVECGKPVDRQQMLDLLLTRAQTRIDALRSGADPLEEWREHLAWIGQPVVVSTPAAVVSGIAETVDGQGALVLRMENGSRHSFNAGDVSLRPGD